MNSFDLDGRSIPFEEGDNILKAALAAGVAIPYFCYHDALGSLGACRLCAVEIEDGRKGPRVVMSCMEPARSGLRVSLHAERAVRARQGVIEFLMTNHPHDCPICDEGGECHLQDMTVACGPAYRRYRGRKRTFPNQDLGPLVHHEMNRCITCYRCTRFYREYALGTDLGAMRLRNEVYFGRFADGPLESPFAGNLVEICPTGVFTDKVFRRTFARVWDLETAPSICPHCSVGCNTLPGARHGTLRRVRNRFHAEINRWFLCDRGRYGHAYTEHSERPLIPRLNGHPVEYRQAVRAAARCIRKAGGGLGVLASCREDLECLAAMKEFAERTGALFAAFVDPSLEGAVTAVGQAMEKRRPPSLAGIEQSDAVLVAGDLTAHAPMMDLAVRQAVRNKATLALLHSTPIPATAYCSLHALAPPAEVPEWLDRLRIRLRSRKISSRGMEGKIAAALIRARRPLLVGVAETLGIAGVKAMAALAEILGERGELALALPGPNAFGAAMFTTSGGAEALLAALEAGNVRTLLVASQDPFGTGPLARRWRQACEGLDDLIVLDCIKTATLRAASIQIPVAAWTERTGIFVNYEGRAQAFAGVFERRPPLPASAAVICEIAQHLDLEPTTPHALLKKAMPGLQIPAPGEAGTFLSFARPTDPVRPRRLETASGHMQAALQSWYGEDPLADFAPDLAGLAPEVAARVSAHTARAAGFIDGDRVTVRGKAGSADMKLVCDAGVAENTIALSRRIMDGLGIAHGDPVCIEATA